MSPAPTDRIELRGLRALGICGVLPEERERRQPFEVDLALEVDLTAAGQSDDLGDTVDYGALAQDVVAVVEGSEFQLLESLARAIADASLADPRVAAVTVRLRKLRPPVPVDLDSSGVRIRRERA
jgi:dihydroneopterin aldolase